MTPYTDEILTVLLILLTVWLCSYYIKIAKVKNGGFDKKEFDRLVFYVLLFSLLILLVNGHEGMGQYFIILLVYWLGKEKLGQINITKQ